MKNHLLSYIKDDEFRLNLFNNRINIVNYTKLINITEKEVSFLAFKLKIMIEGQNLKMVKLENKELLITGQVLKIEVFYG